MSSPATEFSKIDVSNHSLRKWRKDNLLRMITELWKQQESKVKTVQYQATRIRELENELRETTASADRLQEENIRLRARLRNERHAFKAVEDAVSRVRAEYFRNSPEEAAAARERGRKMREINDPDGRQIHIKLRRGSHE